MDSRDQQWSNFDAVSRPLLLTHFHQVNKLQAQQQLEAQAQMGVTERSGERGPVRAISLSCLRVGPQRRGRRQCAWTSCSWSRRHPCRDQLRTEVRFPAGDQPVLPARWAAAPRPTAVRLGIAPRSAEAVLLGGVASASSLWLAR